MYAFNLLTEHKLRYILTSFGIALCALLMLFLLSLYEGVSYGSVEYVRASDADLWVLQKHATNILRSTSLIPASYKKKMEGIEGVKSASPIFFILASVKLKEVNATLYLTGFDPASGIGGPPEIIKGRSIMNDDEIVLDKAFAAKYKINIGDKIPIKDDSLTVTGLSKGTNMFVIQYAFISLKEAHRIIGFRYMVSCYQIQVKPEYSLKQVKASIYSEFNNIVIYDHDIFLKNNLQEMESGIVPLILVVTCISAIVLIAILSLILSINVMEKRKEFAIMKALGSPRGFISGLVVWQSLMLSFTGLAFALILFFPMLNIIEIISPEVSNRTSVYQIIIVFIGVIVISLLSSILPNRKVRKIYPLEVFM